jgi:hypothetical protein
MGAARAGFTPPFASTLGRRWVGAAASGNRDEIAVNAGFVAADLRLTAARREAHGQQTGQERRRDAAALGRLQSHALFFPVSTTEPTLLHRHSRSRKLQTETVWTR